MYPLAARDACWYDPPTFRPNGGPWVLKNKNKNIIKNLAELLTRCWLFIHSPLHAHSLSWVFGQEQKQDNWLMRLKLVTVRKKEGSKPNYVCQTCDWYTQWIWPAGEVWGGGSSGGWEGSEGKQKSLKGLYMSSGLRTGKNPLLVVIGQSGELC